MEHDIKYEFYIDSGVPYIRSNLESNGLDMLKLVAADIGNAQLVKECIEHVRKKQIWWFNSSKIEYESDSVIITPAFDWEAKVIVQSKEFIRILEKFRDFVSKQQEKGRSGSRSQRSGSV